MSSLTQATLALLRKELQIELRTGEIVVTTGLFATLVAVLASLAFYIDPTSGRQVAPGVLWIAITFAGILAMGRSWSHERENDAFRALLLSPVPRSAIYLSKTLASLLFLAIVEAVLLLEVTVLFDLQVLAVLPELCLLLALGTLGFAVTGNLFAAFSVRTRARDMMLAVMVLPVVAPVLLSAVVATRELLAGAPASELYGWLELLAAFDLGLGAAGIALFEPLIAD
ncbi:MAG: heme exporter protein CcmB [Polyangiales bacterium]